MISKYAISIFRLLAPYIYSFVRQNLQNMTRARGIYSSWHIIVRWANNRSIWFMMSEIIERKYIFLYTDRQRILVDCKLDCTWDLFFSVLSAVLNDSREKIDIPGYARGESLELVSFCLRTSIYMREELPVQRLFLYDWDAFSRLEFILFIVKTTIMNLNTCLYMRIGRRK